MAGSHDQCRAGALLLRPARPFDATPCAAIVNDWIDATPWVPRVLDPGEVAWRLREDLFRSHEVTVAEAAREVVGFLALGRAQGVVVALYVTAPARGRGIGAMLLEAAKPASGRLSLWTFQANHGARRFYARHGFVEARRSSDNAERMADVELVWNARPEPPLP